MLLNHIFHKKDDGIIVMKETKPGMCGGTDATQDTKAPKKIHSDIMVFFSVTSVLNGLDRDEKFDDNTLQYVSAFAAPAAGGTFLFLQTSDGFGRRAEKEVAFCVVKESIFPSLVNLVREVDLAKKNGYHSTTHGLPENFGGEVDIRYDSGERISYSDNQRPVLSAEAGVKIAHLFKEAMAGETVAFPTLADLAAIWFEEKQKNGNFTKAVLTVFSDGTGENRKESCYENAQSYESVKPIDKETVDAIKKAMADTGILTWSDLPKNPWTSDSERTLTFVFRDATKITVQDGKMIPNQIRHGFFDIQLEMAVKH